MPVYRSHRIRLPDFMWQALTVLTAHVNETAISDPDERIGVSGLIETIVLASVKVSTLEAIAEASPDFQRAITAWVERQIERDPRAKAVFSLRHWTFTRRTN
jgi:hypothetical protein